MEENKLTEIIIGNAFEVHKYYGSDSLESVNQGCLYYELKKCIKRLSINSVHFYDVQRFFAKLSVITK